MPKIRSCLSTFPFYDCPFFALSLLSIFLISPQKQLKYANYIPTHTLTPHYLGLLILFIISLEFTLVLIFPHNYFCARSSKHLQAKYSMQTCTMHPSNLADFTHQILGWYKIKNKNFSQQLCQWNNMFFYQLKIKLNSLGL